MKSDVTDMEVARAFVLDEALWPLARDFLWDFATQIHESWLDGIDSPESLMDSPRIKRLVLSKLGVEPLFHAFPKGDWSRLALFGGATLESVAKWLGALACAKTLRGVTKGAEVRALKAALPGVYPDVFGFTAYFQKLELAGGALRGDCDMADAVLSAGYGMLVSVFRPLPEALQRRVRLKLPKRLSDMAGDEKSQDARLPGVDGQLLARLLKLKFPEAYRLCCS